MRCAGPCGKPCGFPAEFWKRTNLLDNEVQSSLHFARMASNLISVYGSLANQITYFVNVIKYPDGHSEKLRRTDWAINLCSVHLSLIVRLIGCSSSRSTDGFPPLSAIDCICLNIAPIASCSSRPSLHKVHGAASLQRKQVSWDGDYYISSMHDARGPRYHSRINRESTHWSAISVGILSVSWRRSPSVSNKPDFTVSHSRMALYMYCPNSLPALSSSSRCVGLRTNQSAHRVSVVLHGLGAHGAGAHGASWHRSAGVPAERVAG
eukprot:SAG31_NODE_2922_length_4906_cov_8.279800_1_plen_265_part_00